MVISKIEDSPDTNLLNSKVLRTGAYRSILAIRRQMETLKPQRSDTPNFLKREWWVPV